MAKAAPLYIFLGLPARDCWIHPCHLSLTQKVEGFDATLEISHHACSLLAFGFNALLCNALNKRKEGVTHFALLHADVVPMGPWLKTLHGEMSRFNLDCISAIIPTRSDSGNISTALDTGDNTTMAKLGDFTGTVTSREHPTLLINTGAMLMDITKPWMDKFPGFNVSDNIYLDKADGQWKPACESEDWAMSRWFAKNGVSFGCTDKVHVLHYGSKHWSNKADYPKANGNDVIDMTKKEAA